MSDNDGPRCKRILEAVMDLVREGKLEELDPIQTYPFAEIEDAFRYMQSGAHSGKIVLVPHENDEVMVSSIYYISQTSPLTCIGCSQSQTYLQTRS